MRILRCWFVGFSALAWACTDAPDARDAATDAPFVFGDSASFVDPFGDASLALRARGLFAQTCAGGPETGCHSEHAANLSLSLDGDAGDLIDVPSSEEPSVLRVAPFHPELSYLDWKVTGDSRIDGSVMPLNAYDPRIAGLVTAWIEAGAP